MSWKKAQEHVGKGQERPGKGQECLENGQEHLRNNQFLKGVYLMKSCQRRCAPGIGLEAGICFYVQLATLPRHP
jgi:hypothetical protein